jgi:hypothetical protein
MPFSTDEFKAQITTGLASPSTWTLKLEGGNQKTIGTNPEAGLDEMSRELTFLCNQAVVPGRHFATNEINTYGPIRKMPYQSIYDDLQVSIYCRTEMKERAFFEAWQKMIHNNETHEWGYFDHYTIPLTLTCYSPILPDDSTRAAFKMQKFNVQSGEAEGADNLIIDGDYNMMRTYEVTFEDAYPMNIQPLPLDWATKDGILNLPITFAYRKWTSRRMAFSVEEATPEPRPTGPSWGEILDGITQTIDTIDLYTGAVPSWMTTASRNLNPSGLEGLNQSLGAKANFDNF